MKRAAILFAILFLATLFIPMISISRNKQEEKTDELVTIFSSRCANPMTNYHLLFQEQQWH